MTDSVRHNDRRKGSGRLASASLHLAAGNPQRMFPCIAMFDSGIISGGRILDEGIPKKRVSRETGISGRTINKMLTHEHPPGYGPRRRTYPKLGPYVHTVDQLIHDNDAFPSVTNMTIQAIVEHLRREGFAGSYHSVRNYIKHSESDESKWERAYDLIIRLPKPRALDVLRLLSGGIPQAFGSPRLRLFIREAAFPTHGKLMPAAKGGDS
jgi:hypothetical protein